MRVPIVIPDVAVWVGADAARVLERSFMAAIVLERAVWIVFDRRVLARDINAPRAMA
jgi:hypothetical protein